MTANRATISTIDKERIIAAYEAGDAWTALDEQLNVKKRSAQYIIFRWKKTKTVSKGKRGGVKPVKINDKVGQQLIPFVENNNLATLKEMQAFLSGINVTCSQQTISSFLNLKLMSLKLSRVVPEQRNSQRTIDKRYEFVQWIINGGIQYDKCIYVDECG